MRFYRVSRKVFRSCEQNFDLFHYRIGRCTGYPTKIVWTNKKHFRTTNIFATAPLPWVFPFIFPSGQIKRDMNTNVWTTYHSTCFIISYTYVYTGATCGFLCTRLFCTYVLLYPYDQHFLTMIITICFYYCIPSISKLSFFRYIFLSPRYIHLFCTYVLFYVNGQPNYFSMIKIMCLYYWVPSISI